MKFIAIFSLLIFAYTDANLCPDGANKCPDLSTCCQNRDGSYGCCPFPKAECCSDYIHCCPHGSHCNLPNRNCDRAKGPLMSFKWMVPHYHLNITSSAFNDPEESVTKLEEDSQSKVSRYEGDVCPDGSSCQTDSTCCPVGGDRYGCCPYRNALCCEDKFHCCPHGYHCDIPNQQCTKRALTNSSVTSDNLPIFNVGTNKFELSYEKLLCGTCLLSGKVCCRYGSTVTCCEKGACLPHGKGCKMDGREISGYFYFKSFTNLKDTETKVGIVCPDRTESCPTDNTCCMMFSGRYGCCPMPEATCCPDEVTCCPKDYECVGSNGCERRPYLHLLNLPIFVQRKPYNNL